MIEIRSDDDAEESAGIKTRKVYHYRVSTHTNCTTCDIECVCVCVCVCVLCVVCCVCVGGDVEGGHCAGHARSL